MSEPTPTNAATLTPELADKVRAATISNIVKKIKKGGTPTAHETKLLEDATGEAGNVSIRTVTCSIKDLAELFGYTTQRIDQLTAEGLVVKKGRGKYALWESVRGIVYHRETKKTNQWDGEDGGDYETHRARLTKAKADIAEMDAGIRKAQVHDAGAVAAVWGDMIANAKAKLLSMPTALAGRIHGEESLELVKERIEEAVHQALNELANYDPSLATKRYVSEHSGPLEAAAEVEDEPVGGQPPKAVKRGKRRAGPVAD